MGIQTLHRTKYPPVRSHRRLIIGGLTESVKVAPWPNELHRFALAQPFGPICAAASVHLAAAVLISPISNRESPVEQLPVADTDVFTSDYKWMATPTDAHRDGSGVEVEEILKEMSITVGASSPLEERRQLQNW